MAAGRRPGFAIMAVDSVTSDFTIRVFAASGGRGTECEPVKAATCLPKQTPRMAPRPCRVGPYPPLWCPAVAGPTAIRIPHRQISCDVVVSSVWILCEGRHRHRLDGG